MLEQIDFAYPPSITVQERDENGNLKPIEDDAVYVADIFLDTIKIRAQKAYEKQIPKKGKVSGGTLTICPTCGKGISVIVGQEERLKYCWNCGQRIDWSENNEDT